MARRGPKPSAARLAPRAPLAVDPPPELRLTGRVRQVYRQLAQRICVEGFASAADSRLVALAASTVLSVERLEAAVAELDSLTVTGSQGQVKVNPLLAELRSERQALAGLLNQLFLSPRARSASRLPADLLRQAAAPDEFSRWMTDDGKPGAGS